MANAKTLSTNKLIESISLRAMLPISQVTFETPQFLYFINEEMDLGVVPHILQYHEDYLLFHEEIQLELNVDRYQIPSRAIGTKLKDISISNGNNSWSEMTRISIEDVAQRQFNFASGCLPAFYLEGDEIVIPAQLASANKSLRLAYYIRPNTLVDEADVATVMTINRNNGLVSVNQLPEVFLNNTQFDITSSKSSFRLVSKEIAPEGLASDVNLNFTFGTTRSCNYALPVLGSILNASYLLITDLSQKTPSLNALWFDLLGTNVPPVIPGINLYRINCVTCTSTNDLIALLISTFTSIYTDNRLVISQLSPNSINITNGGIGISVGNNFVIVSSGLVITETVVTPGTITIPKKLNIDDVIALPEQTIIPQIPIELHAMLAQRCAMRCLEALNDISGLQAAQLKLQDMESKTAALINNRVESAPFKIVPRHSAIKRSANTRR